MKYQILMLLLVSGMSFVVCNGQTDIGSAASAGSVTTDHSPGALTPARRLQLQLQELDENISKLDSYLRSQTPNRSVGTDRDALMKAYSALRKEGRQLSPFEFLATAIALQTQPSDRQISKQTDEVAQALEAAGIRNSEALVALAPEPEAKDKTAGFRSVLNKSHKTGVEAPTGGAYHESISDHTVQQHNIAVTPIPDFKTALKETKKELRDALK